VVTTYGEQKTAWAKAHLTILQLMACPGRPHTGLAGGAVSRIEDEKEVRRLPAGRRAKCIPLEAIGGYPFFFSRFACLFSFALILGCFFFSL